MEIENDPVGEVDGGFMRPDILMFMVWIAIKEAVELMEVKVILFSVLLTEHTGNWAIPEPETLAQEVEARLMVTYDGIVIFIFPLEDIGSWVVIVKV